MWWLHPRQSWQSAKAFQKLTATHSPELFRFPSPPKTPPPVIGKLATPLALNNSLHDSGKLTSDLAAFNRGKWDGLDSSYMLHHMEAIVFYYGIC